MPAQSAWLQAFALVRRRVLSPLNQLDKAGGHWFEPSTAHYEKPPQARGFQSFRAALDATRRNLEHVDPPTIRPARPSDVAALAELATRTWSDAFSAGLSPDDEARELQDTRSESYFASALREKNILVAEGDGALLGYVQFGDVGIPEVEVRPGDQGLHRLYIETALQGRGLGRRLMEAALEDPRLANANRIFLQVWAENERAVRLYESFGFQKVGTTTFRIGSEVMEDVVMLFERAGAEISSRR